jgi:acetyltransferase-like isoleucine patch superfamily enzyme
VKSIVRAIDLRSQILGYTFAVPAFAAGIGTTMLTLAWWPLGDFRGVALSLVGAGLCLAYLVGAYRLFLRLFPLPTGDVPVGTRAETAYNVHNGFFLLFFSPLLRSWLIPVPWLRLFYIALGARIGPGSYPSGIITDPTLVRIGHHTIIGQDALIVPHILEGDRVALHPVRIGDRATIGTHAIVLAGTEIGDGAIVAAGAVVAKFTRIGPGETCGGVPAKRLQPTPTP